LKTSREQWFTAAERKGKRHERPDKTAAGKLQKHKARTGHSSRTQREVDILCKYRFFNTKKCCYTSIGLKEVKGHQSHSLREEIQMSPSRT